MRFRPAPIPTVFVAIGLFILLNLGAWQVRRHFERGGHVEMVDSRLTADPIVNADLAGDFDADALTWRKAILRGRFHDVDPVFLAGRYEFGAPGYDLVQPLQLEDGPSIQVVRGWIPSDDWERLVVQTAPDNELVTVHGLLVEPLGDPDAQRIPASDIAPMRFRRDAFGAVRATSPVQTIPLVLVAGDQLTAGVLKSRESYPVTGYIPKPKSLPHVQYAGTWFLIAGTLIVIWAAAGVSRGARLAEG